jgi:hypothetical protein
MVEHGLLLEDDAKSNIGVGLRAAVINGFCPSVAGRNNLNLKVN